MPFIKAEGADMHCEPMARSLLEQRMFDWLDETPRHLRMTHRKFPVAG